VRFDSQENEQSLSNQVKSDLNFKMFLPNLPKTQTNKMGPKKLENKVKVNVNKSMLDHNPVSLKKPKQPSVIDNIMKQAEVPTRESKNPLSLASDYAQRLERMQKRLDKEISKQIIVKDAVKVPKKRTKLEDSMEEKLEKEIDKKNAAMNQGIDLDLFPE
jgi:hypothetical protein